MIVVDASVLATAILDDDEAGHRARTRLRGQSTTAPELIDAEVGSVFRRHLRSGQVAGARADDAIADLITYPLTRVGHRPLLVRAWELRANVTVYDALYVALAELLGAVLVTADARLARAPGLRCALELLD